MELLTQIQQAENRSSNAKISQGYTALGLHPLKLTHVQLLCLDHFAKFEARSIRSNFLSLFRTHMGSVSVSWWLLQASVFSPNCCKKSAKRPRTSSTSVHLDFRGQISSKKTRQNMLKSKQQLESKVFKHTNLALIFYSK